MRIKRLRSRREKNNNQGESAAALPRRKRRLKYIAVLPSFITLMNGVCGFFSIIFASRGQDLSWSLSAVRDINMTSFSMAGYLIILAMVMDMLDGRVARLTRTTSSFGGQLDSLSDAISFGVAPAFLMLKLVESHLDGINSGFSMYSALINRGIFFSAILFAMCALIRLARFNVENEEDEEAHMNFAGLPSPAAAGVVVSLVIFHQYFVSQVNSRASFILENLEIITSLSLPLVTLLTGILMVSRIRYPHLPNWLFRGKKSLPVFLAIFASGLFIVWNIQLAMVFGFCGFALYGFCRWIFISLFRKRQTLPDILADK